MTGTGQFVGRSSSVRPIAMPSSSVMLMMRPSHTSITSSPYCHSSVSTWRATRRARCGVCFAHFDCSIKCAACANR